MKVYISRILAGLFLCSLFCQSNVFAERLRGRLVSSESLTGFKILAIARDGQARTKAVSNTGRFNIKVRKRSSLHIIDSNSAYYGPLVSPRKSRAATLLGGSSGSIGKVRLRSGFATAPKRARAFFLKKNTIPFNTSTGPMGALNFGLGSESIQDAGLTNLAASIGDDSDSDGLPDVLDIDDDGDGALDSVDTDERIQSDLEAVTASTLRLPIENALNVNIGNVNSDAIDTLIQEHLRLNVSVRNNVSTIINSVNVDCGELSYCNRDSGTAVISGPDEVDNSLLGEEWRTYDTDSDGLPNLFPIGGSTILPFSMVVFPKANTTQLRPGDILLLNVDTSNGSQILPALLPFYFVTSPLVANFDDGSGVQTISYPVSDSDVGTSFTNPFILNSTTLTLKFFRPQRPSIGAEDTAFQDMGGLRYGVLLTFPGFVSNEVVRCDSADYSGASDALSVIAEPGSVSDQIFRDSSSDSPSGNSNMLQFTLDLSACLGRASIATSGTPVNVDLVATSESNDQASEQIWFQMP